MNHELKQVDVRLKLVDKEGVFSMESIDNTGKSCFYHGSDPCRT